LTLEQLASLLGTTRGRIRRLEQELVERGWLSRVALDTETVGAVGLGLDEISKLDLAEITILGRRQLASWLGLGAPSATTYHGLIGNDRGQAGRRRRLLRTLAHTLGVNAVFVAFAAAADTATRQGGADHLAEWRGGAACERLRCKPDGYGCYVRNGVSYGFFLEYDRGTESARKYAAKFRAYYWYRDSGQAARDYQGFPTLLFVTTEPGAEQRIADQAYQTWLLRGTEALPILITTTAHVAANPEGIIGPIWRTPASATSRGEQDRHYWLPGGPPRGLFGAGRDRVRTPRLVWPTAAEARSSVGKRQTSVTIGQSRRNRGRCIRADAEPSTPRSGRPGIANDQTP
jgi:hypothetical protein